jgi:hypothetical protein
MDFQSIKMDSGVRRVVGCVKVVRAVALQRTILTSKVAAAPTDSRPSTGGPRMEYIATLDASVILVSLWAWWVFVS